MSFSYKSINEVLSSKDSKSERFSLFVLAKLQPDNKKQDKTYTPNFFKFDFCQIYKN